MIISLTLFATYISFKRVKLKFKSFKMLLRLENIEKSYRTNFEEKCLNGISLKIRDSDIVTVYGKFRSRKKYFA